MFNLLRRLFDAFSARLPSTHAEWYDILLGVLLVLTCASALFWLVGTIYLDVTTPDSQQQLRIYG